MAHEVPLIIRPTIVEARAGWLAVSEPGSLLNIGVIGDTRHEAEVQFKAAVQAWSRLVVDLGEEENEGEPADPEAPMNSPEVCANTN